MSKAQPHKRTKSGSISKKTLKQAGASQFNSVSWSTNRAQIYGTAVDFSVDFTPTDRVEMMKRLRYGERNCGLVRQILGDFVTYVVGSDGITHQSHCADTEKAAAYDEYFAEWCRNCDLTQRFSWAEVQRITVRGALRDGDSFALKVFDEQGRARLQLVEAHRVANPEGVEAPKGMLDGVQFDKVGRVVAYSIIQGDKTAKPVAASSVCHIAEQDYSSGSRGLPLLQHSWADIQTEDELLRLEALAVKNDSDFTRVLTKQGGYVPNNLAAELSGTSGNGSELASKMGGKLVVLSEGEDLKSIQSNRPSPVFVGFLEAIQRDIARGTGLPYEFSGNPTSASGGALRLIAAKADRAFGRWQTITIERLCVPTWGFVIGTAIANGELPDAPDWNKVSWTTPKRLTIDAGRDAAQDRADLELGLLSMSEIYAQRGLDLRTEVQKRAKDFKYIMDTAEKEGVPLWMLYKPGFNWLQNGQGKPTATEAMLAGADPLAGMPEVEDSKADKAEDEAEDEANT
jgi:lambda family phage portal protein